jgi:hypothetical protein
LHGDAARAAGAEFRALIRRITARPLLVGSDLAILMGTAPRFVGEGRPHADIGLGRNQGATTRLRREEVVVARLIGRRDALRRRADQLDRVILGKAEIDKEFWIVNLDGRRRRCAFPGLRRVELRLSLLCYSITSRIGLMPILQTQRGHGRIAWERSHADESVGDRRGADIHCCRCDRRFGRRRQDRRDRSGKFLW